MAWIEFHAPLIKKLLKFRDFRRALGWSSNEALGFLGSFWGEIIELREDGDISGWTPDYIAELTDAKVDPERLWKALQAGWIDATPDGRVLVHDWLDTAGTYLIKKYSSSNRGELVRIWALYGLVYGARSEPIATGKRPEGDPTLPDLTQPNQTKGIGAGGQGQGHEADTKTALEYLNQKAGKAFKAVESTLRPIRARLGEGYTLDDLKRVVDAKVAQWAKDPKMAPYLRPETLFGATKFQGYVNEKPPKAAAGAGIPDAKAQLERLGV